jgi:hypothetical protein
MAYRKSMGKNPRFFQIFEKLGLKRASESFPDIMAGMPEGEKR